MEATRLILREFDRSDISALLSWVTSEREMIEWAGPVFSYPLDQIQLHNHHNQSGLYPLLMVSGAEPVGYIELVEQQQGKVRICRVIVGNPTYRGRGLGKQLVTLAIDYARQNLHADSLNLGVFAHNQVALHCYLSLGFTVEEATPKTYQYKQETWSLIPLKLLIK